MEKITGLARTEIAKLACWQKSRLVETTLEKVVARCRNEILQEETVGQRILDLEIEREGLLDTVWLATSPNQIRQLWSSVSALLGQKESPLQSEAMETEPMKPTANFELKTNAASRES